MAVYKIYEPCVIDACLIKADPYKGREIEVPDNFPPSMTWEPLDEPAKKAMEALLAKRKALKQAEFVLDPKRLQARLMKQYVESLEAGLIDPELTSYEAGEAREALEERALNVSKKKG